jgi:hypothetical protein
LVQLRAEQSRMFSYVSRRNLIEEGQAFFLCLSEGFQPHATPPAE